VRCTVYRRCLRYLHVLVVVNSKISLCTNIYVFIVLINNLIHEWGSGQLHTGFWWKTAGQRPLGRPKHILEDNIKIDLQEVNCGGGGVMDWIDLAQDRNRWWVPVNAVMTL
jgi:hypothetical protein